MNHLAYRHEDEERCAPLSIFEANLRLKPDEECSIANPAAWSTTPDFIGAKMLKSGELIEDKIS